MTATRITEDDRGALTVQPIPAAQPAQNRRVLTPGVVVRLSHLGRVLEAREQARRICGLGESVTTRRPDERAVTCEAWARAHDL